MEEYDDLAFRRFTAKSEADKAINTLKGILLGINFDGIVTDAELQELRNWCQAHAFLINRNPFKDFMQNILQATEDAENRVEIISDLYWLCQKYEGDSYYYNVATTDLQVLQGICHGILADGFIKEEEVVALQDWLQENKYLASYYPYDEIRSVVQSVLADGKVDEQEKKILIAHFRQFVKLTDTELTVKLKTDAEDVMISGICTVDPIIEFPGMNFCFTGVSARAKRSDIEKRIISKGGMFNKSLVKSTDYLIVGDGGNPCWAFACYGRKVETAVELRKQGHKVLLINEMDFWKVLN